jgi:hypothetical protein
MVTFGNSIGAHASLDQVEADALRVDMIEHSTEGSSRMMKGS